MTHLPQRSLRLLILALYAAPLAAQATSQQQPAAPLETASPGLVGARVRAWIPGRPDGWLVGTAVAVDRDGVEIREERSGEVWNILFAGTRLQVSRGPETARYGAAAGAAGGFVLGEALGLFLVRPAGGKAADPGTRTFERLRSPPVLLIGGAGAVGGFIVGRRLRGERWKPVARPARVNVSPTARGVAVGLAF